MTTTVVHCKREPYDVYIGRPSKWGNPFSHRDGTLAEYLVADRDTAIWAYREWIAGQPELLAALPELRGKTLGCWCSPQPCHGDVLAELAESSAHSPEPPASTPTLPSGAGADGGTGLVRDLPPTTTGPRPLRAAGSRPTSSPGAA